MRLDSYPPTEGGPSETKARSVVVPVLHGSSHLLLAYARFVKLM
jgi:hypothetical protein